jgi:membrane protein
MLRRFYENIAESPLLLIAAGVMFYLILALFPGIATLVSVYGLYVDPRTMVNHLVIVSTLVPAGTVDVLREQLTRLGQQSGTTLGMSFLVGLMVSCWTAASGFKAIFAMPAGSFDRQLAASASLDRAYQGNARLCATV